MSRERLIFVLISSGFILIALALIVESGITISFEYLDLSSQGLRHMVGWLSIMVLLVSTCFVILRRFVPRSSILMMKIHCLVGIIPIPLAIYHFSNRLYTIRSIHLSSLLTFFLMLALQITGIILRYFPETGKSRYYLRMTHPPLAVAFYFSLIFHTLDKIA